MKNFGTRCLAALAMLMTISGVSAASSWEGPFRLSTRSREFREDDVQIFSNFRLAFKIKMNGVAHPVRTQSIFQFGGTNTNRAPGFFFQPNSRKIHMSFNDGTGFQSIDAKSDLPNNEWSTVEAIVYDGHVTLSINDKIEAKYALKDGVTPMAGETVPLVFSFRMYRWLFGRAEVKEIVYEQYTLSPTSAPTSSPTPSPTTSPTTSPTSSPTTSPTTKTPTSSPTSAPVEQPTCDWYKVEPSHEYGMLSLNGTTKLQEVDFDFVLDEYNPTEWKHMIELFDKETGERQLGVAVMPESANFNDEKGRLYIDTPKRTSPGGTVAWYGGGATVSTGFIYHMNIFFNWEESRFYVRFSYKRDEASAPVHRYTKAYLNRDFKATGFGENLVLKIAGEQASKATIGNIFVTGQNGDKVEITKSIGVEPDSVFCTKLDAKAVPGYGIL